MLGEALLVFWLLLENRLNRFYGFRPYWLCWDNFLVRLCVYGYGYGFDMVLAVKLCVIGYGLKGLRLWLDSFVFTDFFLGHGFVLVLRQQVL